jgi:hypothetical protein
MEEAVVPASIGTNHIGNVDRLVSVIGEVLEDQRYVGLPRCFEVRTEIRYELPDPQVRPIRQVEA